MLMTGVDHTVIPISVVEITTKTSNTVIKMGFFYGLLFGVYVQVHVSKFYVDDILNIFFLLILISNFLI